MLFLFDKPFTELVEGIVANGLSNNNLCSTDDIVSLSHNYGTAYRSSRLDCSKKYEITLNLKKIKIVVVRKQKNINARFNVEKFHYKGYKTYGLQLK